MSTKNEEKMVTVQGTKKSLKVHLLVAWGLIALAVIMIVNANGDEVAGARGVFLFFCGAVLWLVTKVRIWWHHD